jgi:hypothetical protein
VFAGFDLQQFRLSPDDPGTHLRGRQFGMRAGFEFWHEPTPTTMFAADASVSSIGSGHHARIAYGWRIFDWIYLGPEAQAYYTDPYLQTRLGFHLTSFKIWGREWSGAAGYAIDSNRRDSFYLRVGVLSRY